MSQAIKVQSASGVSLRVKLQRAILGIAVIFLGVAFLASAYISVEYARRYNLRAQTSSHEILAELIKPALQISDYLEIQRLLGLVNTKGSVYSVRTVQGDILLSDYTQRGLINSLGVLSGAQACSQISGQTQFLNGKRWTSYCSVIEGLDGNKKSIEAKQDLLLSIVEVPVLQISMADFGKLLLLLICTLVFSVLFLRSLLAQKLLGPLEELVRSVKQREHVEIGETVHEIILKGDAPKEIDELRISFNELLSVIQQNYRDRQELKTNQALAHLAQQVAHDIRSPLAALNMVIQSTNALPEDIRLLIRQSLSRIRDIANSLLQKNKVSDFENINHTTKVLLSSIMDSLITEKRLQFHERADIIIDFFPTAEAYGQFVEVDGQELKRVLSNIGNNAVEAISSAGNVSFNLLQDGKFALIEVLDNGCGMSSEQLDKIGTRGFSLGKKGRLDNGSGLGVYHAKSSIQSWGGLFTVESSLRNGCKVSIRLPLASPPEWFYPKIELSKYSTLVVFDDDSAIHTGWENRLGPLCRSTGKNINIVHIYSPNQLRSWVIQNVEIIDTCLFLVDFEILGFPETGLDLIEEMGLQFNSVLVTSRYEEPGVQARCERLGVGVIPKGMAGIVPIIF